MAETEEWTVAGAGGLRAERPAEAVWAGALFEGSGTVSVGSRAFAELPITRPSRIENSDGKTSPEELLAAPHAGCFSMACSLVLAEAGTPPEELTAKTDLRVRAGNDGIRDHDDRPRRSWSRHWARAVTASASSPDGSAYYLDAERRPRGVLLWNSFGRVDAARDLIGARLPIDESKLSEPVG